MIPEGTETPERRIGYLSGAPLVSTREETALPGPRAHVLGVMRAFEALGWEVQPYIVGDKVPLRWVTDGRTEHTLRSNYLKRALADGLRWYMSVLNGWRATREIGEVDWVYERLGAFQALGWWFKRRGIPWILETNALLFREASADRASVAFSGLQRLVECWAYHRCDVLICVSQALADMVVEQVGIDPRKIVIMPNGVDTAIFDPRCHQPKRLFQGCTIGFVGQLHAWQRLDLLIEVLTELRAEDVDLKLVVIGDGPHRAEWESLARRLGQSQHTRFLGRVPWSDVPKYIAGFDIGYVGPVPLSPGVMYLSPLKLYEYAAMSRPILASDFDEARILVKEASCGYIFRMGNKKDLKRVLRQAYAEQHKWNEMGRRARKIVVERHSWHARVRDAINKIESILEEAYGAPYPARRRS
ncbi:glycosyltransferase [Thermaerobacter composti]|uniref:Glycosyltransferase n=1 Tax=Thermaerobacter composti TaxID=554949 RepID=A0ABZ0QQD7_9FIRM|nr:glycosyltransferase [Thermaerobacter composti]WPD19722.1 glycosyltransferase [Thermaerobacter composti]